jgi:hypothetical protein
MDNFPKVLSMGDVMRILGVSRPRINELVRREKLRYQDTAAGKVFLENEVMAYKKDREKRSKTDPRIKKGRPTK